MPVQVPSPQSRKHARIEIIPLIDIVFFLLATFVMVSLAMVKNKGIPVNLPVASSGAPQDRKDFTSITLTEKGEVYMDKQPVSLDALDAALKDLLQRNPDPRVFINGDAKADFGRAVEVLDRLRRAGIAKIAIETRPPAAAGAAPTPAGIPAAPAASGTPAPASPAAPAAPQNP